MNHCPSIECGKDFCHDRGYYRLKEDAKDTQFIPYPISNQCETAFTPVTPKSPQIQRDEIVTSGLFDCFLDLEMQMRERSEQYNILYERYKQNGDDERMKEVLKLMEKQRDNSNTFNNCKLVWSN